MALAEATREVYWNIPGHLWMYAFVVPALVVFVHGVSRRVALWRKGRPHLLRGPWGARLESLLLIASTQSRLMADRRAAWLHTLLLGGVLVLAVATTVVFLHQELGVKMMHGAFYLVFQSLLVDLFGLGATVAIAAVLWRGQLGTTGVLHHGDTRPLLAALLLNVLAGFMLEGLRIAATDDAWGAWSPVGFLVALAAKSIPAAALLPLHQGIWWGHLVLSLVLIAYLPFSSFVHVFMLPLNRLLHAGEPKPGPVPAGARSKEGGDDVGVVRLSDFTWRDLVDVDACIDCGRCDQVCPVNAVGGPLSPRLLMQGMQSAGRAGRTEIPMVGAALSPAALWACTTCGGCVQICPSESAPLPKFLDLRRGELEEGRVPRPLLRPLESLQRWGNPLGEPPERRADWMLSLPRSAQPVEDSKRRLLFWVGCAGAYNPTIQTTSMTVVKVLRHAAIPFTVLGNAELCCGDPARRAGEEGLFRQLAAANIAAIDKVAPSRIMTHCAHCFQVLREEYPDLGGRYQVIHHTQLLDELSASGHLKTGATGCVTYHDPCYLGRHGGCFDAPRGVLAGAGLDLREMEDARELSRCCGAGGGQMWLESGGYDRMNARRFRQAAATGAGTLVTACPYCKLMLDDAAATKQEPGQRIVVKDIAELFAEG